MCVYLQYLVRDYASEMDIRDRFSYTDPQLYTNLHHPYAHDARRRLKIHRVYTNISVHLKLIYNLY